MHENYRTYHQFSQFVIKLGNRDLQLLLNLNSLEIFMINIDPCVNYVYIYTSSEVGGFEGSVFTANIIEDIKIISVCVWSADCFYVDLSDIIIRLIYGINRHNLVLFNYKNFV